MASKKTGSNASSSNTGCPNENTSAIHGDIASSCCSNSLKRWDVPVK
ncbi:hypothetical protein OAT73_01715 [Candidatus Poseidoniaceae archaeon]|nr:hypothetical protein [Candidatus Poseidoniaceae archaeon]